MEHIANSYDEFIEKICDAERRALNSNMGQQITSELLNFKLSDNPKMTAEEWNRTKQEFMLYLFNMVMKEQPELFQEMGEHLYHKLRGEENARN